MNKFSSVFLFLRNASLENDFEGYLIDAICLAISKQIEDIHELESLQLIIKHTLYLKLCIWSRSIFEENSFRRHSLEGEVNGINVAIFKTMKRASWWTSRRRWLKDGYHQSKIHRINGEHPSRNIDRRCKNSDQWYFLRDTEQGTRSVLYIDF